MQFTEFRTLAIGDRFRFASEFTMPYSGMKTGVCRKTSSRCYVFEADGMRCQVGSTKAEVAREDKDAAQLRWEAEQEAIAMAQADAQIAHYLGE